jgi:hypothetical protein
LPDLAKQNKNPITNTLINEPKTQDVKWDIIILKEIIPRLSKNSNVTVHSQSDLAILQSELNSP